jgi:uncharacterized protein YoxC
MGWLSNSNEKALAEILRTVRRLETKGDMTMATIQDVQQKLDAIPEVLNAIAADGQAQKDLIQSLKDQIAQGNPVTQEQLDELDAKPTAILSRSQEIDASVG